MLNGFYELWRKNLQILAIADLHFGDRQTLETVRNYDFDYNTSCVLLGDIPLNALIFLREIIKQPIFGILGNHDEFGQLERCGIENLDRKIVTINGVKIAGLSGSHRYKHGDYPLLTQRESIAAAKAIPAADILISHDTAYRLMGRKDAAHCGLKGISRYISRREPVLNLCGHYHENVSKKCGKCKVRCVFGCTLIEFKVDKDRRCRCEFLRFFEGVCYM